jgi:hypothetical protein
MPTLAELRAERARGPTPADIEINRRVLVDGAVSEALAALDQAADAVAGVAAVSDLATAQTAVDGVGDTISAARGRINLVIP